MGWHLFYFFPHCVYPRGFSFDSLASLNTKPSFLERATPVVPARSQAHRQGRGKGHWLSCSVDTLPPLPRFLPGNHVVDHFWLPVAVDPQLGDSPGSVRKKEPLSLSLIMYLKSHFFSVFVYLSIQSQLSSFFKKDFMMTYLLRALLRVFSATTGSFFHKHRYWHLTVSWEGRGQLCMLTLLS